MEKRKIKYNQNCDRKKKNWYKNSKKSLKIMSNTGRLIEKKYAKMS